MGETYYYFEISSDGYYKIAKFIDDEYFEIIPWEDSDAIFQGDATNHIRAECIGDTLKLYANGIRIAEARDDEIQSGFVGLLAGTFDTPGVDILLDILFDNFLALEP